MASPQSAEQEQSSSTDIPARLPLRRQTCADADLLELCRQTCTVSLMRCHQTCLMRAEQLPVVETPQAPLPNSFPLAIPKEE
jgi:hypothetical protein